jgi:hypothetical protein
MTNGLVVAGDGEWLFVVAPGTEPAADGGKWLLWFDADRIDQAWQAIRTETEAGRLGLSAKRAVHPNPGGRFLICVYTLDHRDRQDVGRVLQALRDLGHMGRLCYKEDNATYAGLYGAGASLYVARSGKVDFEQRRAPVEFPRGLGSGTG